jgi:hypothetical protein
VCNKSLTATYQCKTSKWQVTNYLSTITNEPIGLITLITSWLTSKLLFPPFRLNEYHYHNSPMPQLSSTGRLIMAANDMTNTLKDPHPAVPFAQVGDDTIAAITQVAEIFKNKFQKVKAPELSNAPIKAAKNKIPAVMAQPIITSPIQHKYQTRSQTKINTEGATNTPLRPRVITPMTDGVAPPRVRTLSQNISPRNLSQYDFWNIYTANIAVSLRKNHWSEQHFSNAVVHPVTGKQMEYMALMKDPDL